MRKPNLRTIATLAPVGAGLVVLTQLHYVIGHFGTIALVAGAVTVGASMLVKGKAKPDAEPEADETSTWHPALPEARTALPPAQASYLSDEVIEAQMTKIRQSMR